MRFLGNIEARTDAKGRVFLPASFRKVLYEASQNNLMMRKDIFQNCLVLYPESEWNKQLDSLRNRLNRWNAKHQMIFRQFVAEVEMVTPDANGRILIPKRLRQAVGIEQDVHFIGMDSTIELWASESLEAPFMDAGDLASALEDVMKDTPKPNDTEL